MGTIHRNSSECKQNRQELTEFATTQETTVRHHTNTRLEPKWPPHLSCFACSPPNFLRLFHPSKFQQHQCQEPCAQGIKSTSKKDINGGTIAEVVGKRLVRPPDVVHIHFTGCSRGMNASLPSTAGCFWRASENKRIKLLNKDSISIPQSADRRAQRLWQSLRGLMEA